MPWELISTRGMTEVQRSALLTLHGYSGAGIPVERQPFINKRKWRQLGVSLQQVKALENIGYLEVNRDKSVRLTPEAFANIRKVRNYALSKM